MAQQLINLGDAPNDGKGDTLRTGGNKINANFAELYSSTSALAVAISNLDSAKLNKSGGTLTGGLNLGGFKLENVGAPDSDDDALNRGYGDQRYFLKGQILNVAGFRIEGLGAPDSDDDAANKSYVDSAVAGLAGATSGGLAAKLDKAGGTMTGALNLGGFRLEGVGAPDSDDDAISRGYLLQALVDNLAAQGLVTVPGFETDLAGIVQAELSPDGTAVSYRTSDGVLHIVSNVDLIGFLSTASITVGGVAETSLAGYEADLIGTVFEIVGSDNRKLSTGGASPADAAAYALAQGDYAKTQGDYAKAQGDAAGAGTGALAKLGYEVPAGWESDLSGIGEAYIGTNGNLIWATDLNGKTTFFGTIGFSLAPEFAEIILGGFRETNVSGYEADLMGTAYELIGSDGKRMASSSAADAASSLSQYTTAMHPDGSSAYVVSVSSKPQVAAYDGVTGKSLTLTSTGSNVAPAITSDRKVIFTSDRDGVPKRYWKPVAGGTTWPFDPSTALAMFGDSIGSDGSGISATVASYYPSRLFYKNGIGGQRSPEIAQRQGGRPTTGILAGNTIPASGAVAVTGISLYNGAANRSILMIVYGLDGTPVPGTMAYNATSGVYTFTRTTAGSAIAVPNPAVVEVVSGLSGEGRDVLDVATQIWVSGRNDVGKPEYNADNTLANIASMVANLKPIRRQFVLCGIKNGQVDKLTADGGTQSTDVASKARFDQVIELNSRYAAAYPQNYVDWMAAAQSAGLTEAYTVGGSTYQVIKAEVDSDGLHPNDAVGKPFFGGLVRDFINGKGW